MPKFCDQCHNLLTVQITPNEFTFECSKCSITFQPEPSDMMRHESLKTTNLSVYHHVVKTIVDDPVNPKVYKKCPKCGHGVAKQVRLGNNMRLINGCISCRYKWAEIANEDVK